MSANFSVVSLACEKSLFRSQDLHLKLVKSGGKKSIEIRLVSKTLFFKSETFIGQIVNKKLRIFNPNEKNKKITQIFRDNEKLKKIEDNTLSQMLKEVLDVKVKKQKRLPNSKINRKLNRIFLSNNANRSEIILGIEQAKNNLSTVDEFKNLKEIGRLQVDIKQFKSLAEGARFKQQDAIIKNCI
jgi:hypothetical protein